MEDLRECPCCGKPGDINVVRTRIKPGVFLTHGWVGCPKCGLYKQWTYDPTGAIRTWNRREAPVQPNMRPIDANALYRMAVSRAEKRGQYFNELDRVISPKDIEDSPTIIPSAGRGERIATGPAAPRNDAAGEAVP